MKRIYLFILLFSTIFNCTAQTIELHFPSFSGKEYTFCLFKGGERDTVQTGLISSAGNATLIIPNEYKNYTGSGVWSIEQFGSVSFIINNENFRIVCTEPHPSDETIVYENSPENDFRSKKYSSEQELLNKIQTINYGLSLYSQEDAIYTVFEKEILQLKTKFEDLQDEIGASQLYAARFLKILDFTNGITDRLLQSDQRETGREALIKTFSEKINMEDLYTSGVWSDALYFAMELYSDETSLASSIIEILNRTSSQPVFEDLASDIIKLTEMYGSFEARAKIASYLKDSGRISNPQGIIANAIESLTSGSGLKAPAIGDLDLSKKLIIFYDSQCGNCMEEVENMILSYPKLQEKGYDVISISANANKGLFEFTSKNFPWKNKLCDFNSFDGENFVNYGIIGTPTIIHINEKGIIEGTYAAVLDTGLIN
ncbi:MAG: thioredoxin family protein [Bacteroidales bacterium]|nr:thioredoxin family protein [Bacteroidales bacterium]